MLGGEEPQIRYLIYICITGPTKSKARAPENHTGTGEKRRTQSCNIKGGRLGLGLGGGLGLGLGLGGGTPRAWTVPVPVHTVPVTLYLVQYYNRV